MNMENNDINSSLGRYLHLADRKLINRLQRNFYNAGHDITVEQWTILLNLFVKNGQNQQALSDITGKDKSGMTRLVNGLEKRNLVVRIPDQIDRRNKLIYLTPKGKNIKDALVLIAETTLAEATVGISEEELEHLKRLLTKIIGNLSS